MKFPSTTILATLLCIAATAIQAQSSGAAVTSAAAVGGSGAVLDHCFSTKEADDEFRSKFQAIAKTYMSCASGSTTGSLFSSCNCAAAQTEYALAKSICYPDGAALTAGNIYYDYSTSTCGGKGAAATAATGATSGTGGAIAGATATSSSSSNAGGSLVVGTPFVHGGLAGAAFAFVAVGVGMGAVLL